MPTTQHIYNINTPSERWLPTSKKEVEKLGWDYIDVILFSGDAYIDHPSMGSAVIGRFLQSKGYRVAIVPQPNWRDDLRDFKKLGKPRICFGISAGAMDSMVNHYTAGRRRRSDDAYTPDGKAGMRPDMPTIVYSRILKELFPDVPVILYGHSMGSFYARWYAEIFPESITAAIFSGTAGPGAANLLGQPLAALIAAVKGNDYVSPFMVKLNFGSYCRKIENAQSPNAWTYHLSYRNATAVEKLGNTVYGPVSKTIVRDAAVGVGLESHVVAMDEAAIEHSSSGVSDRLTVSVGIATVEPLNSMNSDVLREAAARALKKAKDGGRNQVAVSSAR